MLYDLHSHSTASDGTLSPVALVQRAAEQGVDVLALTDHDTTAGLAEADHAAQQCGIHLIKGVEISVTWEKQTIHVLGLNINDKHEDLLSGLQRLRDFRQTRAQEIALRLEKAGINDAYNGAKKYAHGQLIGRTHFARYLVECGKASNVSSVFKKYLVKNKPGHVGGEWAALDEVIAWIKAANGHAVIAHPARYKMSATKLRRLIETFKELGGAGLEVVSGNNNKNDKHNMAQYARRYELHASCGSDYHGPENPWIELGRLENLPEGCQPIWTLWE